MENLEILGHAEFENKTLLLSLISPAIDNSKVRIQPWNGAQKTMWSLKYFLKIELKTPMAASPFVKTSEMSMVALIRSLYLSK